MAVGWTRVSGPDLKRSPANLAKRNIGQLTALVVTRLRRMQYSMPTSTNRARSYCTTCERLRATSSARTRGQ